MRNMVKLSFVAFVLLLISCSNDFPSAPEMKFCMLENGKCESIHVISKKECEMVGGKIIPETEEEDIPDACKRD